MDIVPPSPRNRLRCLRESRDLRQRTFTNNGWPSSTPVSVEDLLDDGFFYVGSSQDDRVQCSYCGNVLHGFRPGDNVHIEHYRHFPHCDRFYEVDDKYRHLFSQDVHKHQTDDIADNSKPRYNPRHKYYGTVKDRLKTFRNWAGGHKPDPESLARAGLFYTGSGDCCECFYCGGQLDQWKEGDIPQQEHDSFCVDICPLAKT